MQGLVRHGLVAGAGISRSGCSVCIQRGTMPFEIASRQVVELGAIGTHANAQVTYTPAAASFINRRRNHSKFLQQSNMIRIEPILKLPRWICHPL